MAATSVSLLERLKTAKPDAAEWRRLQDIYQPLIRAWLRQLPELGDETGDLTQEVFLVMLRELPSFERQREGSFRSWLRRVTVNRVRTFVKRRGRQPTAVGDGLEVMLSQLEDPHGELAQRWEREHDRHVFQKLLETFAAEFNDTTWRAFQRFGIEGQSAAATALELGISENSVLLAKSRVLKRLRTEASGLLD